MEGLESMMDIVRVIGSLESVNNELATYELTGDDEFDKAMKVVVDGFRTITDEAKKIQKATLILYQLSELEGLE